MSFKDEISFTVPVSGGAGLEEEQEVVAEFTVTSWGSPPSGLSGPPEYSDPGEPPEWEIDKIFLDGDEVPYDKDPESLWQRLAAKANDYIDENYDFEPPEPDYD